ncbi:MAG: hypothetical protein IK080_08880 [Clostridia bacterium]|nr:hypothetical protein [Clostridia bacterium]
MKKTIRLCAALLLTLTLLLTPVLPAFAADGGRDCPYIYVHGFMGVDIHADAEDPDSPVIWPPSSDTILDAVKAALPAIARLAIDHNYDAFADALMPAVSDIFNPVICTPEGTVEDGSGPVFTYPDADSITPGSELSFKYDWRLDPIVIAGQLNDFINYVCESSGCDQVVLECHSFGGVVTLTYTTLYGTSRLRSVMLNTTAIFGEDYNGELMTGHLGLDADALTAYLKAVLSDNEYRTVLYGTFDLLNAAGLTDVVCALGNRMIEKLGDRVLPEVIVPMFGGWLSVWSMVPDQFIDEATDYVFNTIYKDDPTDRSVLVGKIENFNAKVRAGKTQMLQQMNEDMNLYVMSRYNFCGVFLTPSWKNMSDTTVDTKYSSFGATCAEYDAKLTEAQLAGKDPAFISPDQNVDASTCLFPQQIWFVKDFLHANTCGDEHIMILTLLYHEGQADVDTYEAYPRYLVYNNKDHSIKADGGPTQSFLQRVIAAVKDFFERIRFTLEHLFPKVI